MDHEASLPEGMYDALLTSELLQKLAISDLEARLIDLAEAEAPARLADHVERALIRELADRKASAQVSLTNEILERLGSGQDLIAKEPQLLRSLLHVPGPGQPPRYTGLPRTPLSEAALITNGIGDRRSVRS